MLLCHIQLQINHTRQRCLNTVSRLKTADFITPSPIQLLASRLGLHARLEFRWREDGVAIMQHQEI